jgi:uncharacterized cupredoxin-like copper-binding protein
VRQRIIETACAFAVALAGLALADTAAAQTTAPHRAAHHAAPATSPHHAAPAAAPHHAAPATSPRHAAHPAPSQAPAEPDTTITIRTVGSDLEFRPAEIAVKAGTRLRIRYVNEGTFPHNIVIAKQESDIDPLGLAAFNAGSTGYVPLDMTDRMVAHSPLAEPGKTIEFEFVVPAPGEYPFVCLYPGHYNMMVGSLRSLP